MSCKMARQKSLPIEFHDWELEARFQGIHFVAKGDNQIKKSNDSMKSQPSRNKQTSQDGLKNTRRLMPSAPTLG
jgi:hypothetical protein